MKLLLIDNNDSFTFNLSHQIIRLTGYDIDIILYENLAVQTLDAYDGYIISPGPGHPSDYENYNRILEIGKPVFGVCLGMQIINRYFGGEVVRLADCSHGVTLVTDYKDTNFEVAVYNSLYCSKVANDLDVFAKYNNIPMALIHNDLPYAGVQFHPESFLTPFGDEIINDVFSSIGLI